SFQVNGQPATVNQEAGTDRKTLSFDGIELDVTDYMTENAATDGAFTVETRQMSFYSVKTPVPIANANSGGAASMSFEYGDIGELTTNDFQVEFKDGNYVMTRMPQGDQVASATPDAQGKAVISFGGFQMTMQGAAAEGDSWVIQPTRNGARDTSVSISDPSAIAAADLAGGSANGRNPL